MNTAPAVFAPLSGLGGIGILVHIRVPCELDVLRGGSWVASVQRWDGTCCPLWGIGSRKLRPLAFIGVVGSVPGSVTRADVVPEPTKQSSVPQGSEAANGCAGCSCARPSRPRARASTGGHSRASLEDLPAELIIEVRAHDEDLKAFKLIDRPIHAGYQQLRTTANSGGGGKKEEAKAGVTAGA